MRVLLSQNCFVQKVDLTKVFIQKVDQITKVLIQKVDQITKVFFPKIDLIGDKSFHSKNPAPLRQSLEGEGEIEGVVGSFFLETYL